MSEIIYGLVIRRPKLSVAENSKIEMNPLQVIACSVSEYDREIFIGHFRSAEFIRQQWIYGQLQRNKFRDPPEGRALAA